MIRCKDTILEDFFIDPITAVITNSKGEIQKIKIKDGRPYFKRHWVHQWQVHTHIGYKEGYDIHHLDENKMNNSLSNLVYLTHSEHAKIHNKIGKKLSDETKRKLSEAKKQMSEETKRKISEARKGKHHSKETKRKMSESMKGEKHPLYGKHHTEESKKKMSEANKGKNHPLYGKHRSAETNKKISDAKKGTICINNGVENRYIPLDEAIPEGFVRGMLKRKNK